MSARARTLGLVACLLLGTADLLYLNARLAPSLVARPERRPPPVTIAVAIEPAPGPLDAPAGATTPRPAPPEPVAVHFPRRAASVDLASARTIAQHMQRVREGGVVVVEGHADEMNDETANLRLSRRRADAVARRLRAVGIPSQRIVVRSFGSRRPAAEGKDWQALELNRRVEIFVERGPL